jgi:hypothetical protein
MASHHSLLGRADCEASGVNPQHTIAMKDGFHPFYLCGHHAARLGPALVADGWVVENLSQLREAVRA